jgi:hypothetical protein
MASILLKITLVLIVIAIVLPGDTDEHFNKRLNSYLKIDGLRWEEYFIGGLHADDFLVSSNYFSKALDKKENAIIYLYFGALYAGFLDKDNTHIDYQKALVFLDKSKMLDYDNLTSHLLLGHLKYQNTRLNESKFEIVFKSNSRIDFYSEEITSYSYALMQNLGMLTCSQILHLASLQLDLPRVLIEAVKSYYQYDGGDRKSKKLYKFVVKLLNEPANNQLYAFKYEKDFFMTLLAIKLIKSYGGTHIVISDYKLKLKALFSDWKEFEGTIEKWDEEKNLCLDSPYWADAIDYSQSPPSP